MRVVVACMVTFSQHIKYIGAYTFSRLFRRVTSQFNTEYDLQELMDFGEDQEFVSASRAYEQSVEKTKSNIKWMDANAVAVKEWLENANSSP